MALGRFPGETRAGEDADPGPARRAGESAAMISLIRRRVFFSMPLVRLTTSVSGARRDAATRA